MGDARFQGPHLLIWGAHANDGVQDLLKDIAEGDPQVEPVLRE